MTDLKSYFIVGGAGFIGSHFTDHLLASPETTAVTLYDNFSSGRTWHYQEHTGDPRFRVVKGDVHELDLLTALPCSRAVPGHGPASVAWPAGAADEQRYLTTVLTETRQMIAKGAELETAVNHVAAGERSRWTLFVDYNGRNVTVAFKELEWE